MVKRGTCRQIDRPKGEDTQLLHDVKFAGLVEVEDIRKQAWIPVKIKLLLLHVIIVTYLQERGRREMRREEKRNREDKQIKEHRRMIKVKTLQQ